MPLYDYRCEQEHRFERVVKLADLAETQHCACGSEAIRLISSPRFSVDQTDYTCPITGKWVGSVHEHRNNLARHNCRVLETGEKASDDKVRAGKEAQFEKSLDETVERQFDSYSSDKKEQLCNELVNQRLDINLERKSTAHA